MAVIRLTVDTPLVDGQSLTFKAPCDCTAVTGIKIGDTTFVFKDAHKNLLTGVGNLFVTGAYVKVVLDTTNNVAYIQNADTNEYIENTKVPNTRKVNNKPLSADITLTAEDVGAAASAHDHAMDDLSGVLPLSKGGTGATTAAAALAALGGCATADIGNLHVWKKTVMTSSPVDAYIEKGPVIDCSGVPIIYLGQGDNEAACVKFSFVEPVVTDEGNVQFSSTSGPFDYIGSVTSGGAFYFTTQSSSTKQISTGVPGHYIYFSAVSAQFNSDSNVELNTWYYVPSDATLTYTESAVTRENMAVIISKLQKVIGHPAIPTGTSVTYPVSTNRNAYQEGSDAKAASYVLGEKTISYVTSNSEMGATAYASLSDSVSVDDSGNVSLVSPANTQVALETNSGYTGQAGIVLRGKYILRGDGTIWYIPADSTISYTFGGVSAYGAPYNYCFTAEMQPVTGIAAIPAGTVIEYLGCLGDKGAEHVLTYVGTGTYGADNPCSITAKFPIQRAYALNILNSGVRYESQISTDDLTTTFVSGKGFTTNDQYSHYGKKSEDNKTIYWYTTSDTTQLNAAGIVYAFLVV